MQEVEQIDGPSHYGHGGRSGEPAVAPGILGLPSGNSDGGQEEHPLSLLREHDGYHLLMRATADGHSQLVLAPDARGRQLAAVFTAEDCLQAFMDRVLTQVKPLPLSLMLSGQELFERLVAMPLQGIVFNCAGPVQPHAGQLALAPHVQQA